MSDLGKRLALRLEGCVLRVYLDQYGYPTGGIGHLLSNSEQSMYPVGTKLSAALVEAWFAEDIGRVDKVIDRLGVALNENQYAALESLLFNAGVGMLWGNAPRAPKLRRALLAQDWPEAASEFLDICHATDQQGHVVRDEGLAQRRIVEAELFLRPVSVDAEQVLAMVSLTLDRLRRETLEVHG